MNQSISEKSNSFAIKISIVVFILIIIFVPFYESKKIMIWGSQSEGQQYNIFDYFVFQYVIFSEEIKKDIGLNIFFNQEYGFWSKIKESPVILQQDIIPEETKNVKVDAAQVKIFADIIKKQTIFNQAYNFWLNIQEKNKQAREQQFKELPIILADILKNRTGVDISLLINPKPAIPEIEQNSQIADIQTNKNSNQQEDIIKSKENKPSKPKVEVNNQIVENQTDDNIDQNKRENPVAVQENNSTSLRSLIIGDSFMAVGGGLGDVVEKAVVNYGDTKVNRYGVVSSGLARPDYFDWNSKIKELVVKYKPNIAIVMFGANDNQNLTDEGGNLIVKYGGQAWQEEYAKRVSDMLDVFKENNITVFWVGLPVMRKAIYSQYVENLNLVYQNECQKYQNAYFISTWKTLADNNGNYSAYLKDKQGKNELARIGDGVHLTYFGGALVTDEILKKIQEVLGSV
ncbi:MAG: DUF459 domain-containing protein [Candidatus Staskawiczbacteria bacterium]|nr:DUF459 domain-containing protein [Candidatus Staskawiczbacteria bacterium]